MGQKPFLASVVGLICIDNMGLTTWGRRVEFRIFREGQGSLFAMTVDIRPSFKTSISKSIGADANHAAVLIVEFPNPGMRVSRESLVEIRQI